MCTELVSVDIPESVLSIGARSFADNSSLISVELHDGIQLIDRGAFSGCSNLTKIVLPDSINTISGDSFMGCDNEFTIYGHKGTAAETYANENDCIFVDIDAPQATAGDINADGKANIADAVLLQKYLLVSEQFTKEQYEAADLNGDSSVDVFDMIAMRKIITKK